MSVHLCHVKTCPYIDEQRSQLLCPLFIAKVRELAKNTLQLNGETGNMPSRAIQLFRIQLKL